MTAYDAGTAFLQIVPSWRGWDADVTAKIRTTQEQLRKGIADALPAGFREGARAAAPEGAKAGEEFGGAFGRSVRLRIEAALKSLPKVELKADSSDTDRKIADVRAKLEALRDKRIGVDIDEGAALAEIKVLTTELDRLGSKSPSIGVRIDAARASAELAAVNAEVDRLDGRTARVSVITDRISGGGGGLGLASFGVAAAPLAAPLGAAGLGLGAGVTTALGAGAAGLGVLGLGLSGVSKAVQDISAANMQAGATATAAGAAQVRAALAVAAAERQVKSAEEGLAQARANAADAAITAAERVQSALAAQAAAERNLTTAQQTQAQAQAALTQARKTAAQQLQDRSNQVTDGQLGLRQGQLDVTNARLNLQGVDSNPLSTQQQRQQAQLDYDQAVQRLKELRTQQGRLTDVQKDAAKKGVAGSDVVVQAQHNLAQATQAVTDAYTAQAAAEQAVSDARRQQATQIRQSAYAIEQAQNSILSAQAAVQSASLQSATAGGALTTRLAAMSAPLRAFATFVNDTLRPAFNHLRTAVQGALLPDLQTGLTTLLPVLPALTSFATALADTMGRLFIAASKALTSPFWQGFFGFVSRTAGPVLSTLAHIVGNIVTGLAGLLQAFYPVSKGIGDGILHLTQRFADFGKHLGTNSGFQSFLAYVKRETPVVGRILADLATIIGKMFEGLAGIGASELGGLQGLLHSLAGLSPAALRDIALAVGGVFLGFKLLGPVVSIVSGALKFLGPIVEAVTAMFGGEGLAGALAALGGPVTLIIAGIAAIAAGAVFAYLKFKPFRDFIDKELVPALKKLADQALAGIHQGLKFITDAVGKNRKEFGQLGDVLHRIASFVVQYILPIWGTELKTVFEVIGIVIASVIQQVANLVDTFITVRNGIESVVGYVKHLPARITAVSHHMWDGIKDSFKAAINYIIDAWNGLDFKLPSLDLGPLGKVGGFDIRVPQIPRLAQGGEVVGPGSWTSDTAGLWALSNGEHVWPAREVAAVGGQQAMYQLRHVLTGYAAGGAVGGGTAGLLSTTAGIRAAGLARLNDLAGGAVQPLHYEQHLHYPVPDSVSHGQMRAQQILLHELSNR